MAALTRTSIFSLKGVFLKYWELSPLVVILGGACLGAGSFSTYAISTKADVAIDKRQTIPPWERVNRESPQKLMTFNIKYEKEPSKIAELRKEIGSYRY